MAGLPTVPVVAYETVRPLIQSGDLLLCAGSSPMSKMIQAATGSQWSHVGFVMVLQDLQRVVVLESVESIGIRACTLSRYITDYNGSGKPYPGKVVLARHRQVDFTELTHLQTFSKQAVDLLGCPYDTRQLASIALRLVAHKLGLPPQPPQTNNAFICSEFVAACMVSIGIIMRYDDLGYIAPKHFAECPEVELLWEVVRDGT